jgi:hypothetical protein
MWKRKKDSSYFTVGVIENIMIKTNTRSDTAWCCAVYVFVLCTQFFEKVSQTNYS